MLTRIEIDGFKSFEEFGLDLSPFAVVLGSNASGKSNLFDAIQLLSHLAESDLRSAFKSLRGDSEHLFRETRPGQPVDSMRLAAEVLLEPSVRDPWGEQVTLTHTRLRYEVTIERSYGQSDLPRLVVSEEKVVPILAKDEPWRPYGRSPGTSFRDAHLRYARRVPWLETLTEEGRRVLRIHQDGKAGRTRPGHAAEATVLSSITTAEFPHLYALREEMRSWRLLQLDPAGLRKPSPLTADETLLADGSNLAAVLYRIQAETQSETSPHGALAEIAAELAEIIPGVLDVSVARDEAAREYRATVALRDGFSFPTSVISDGTLRVLALLTLLHDPRQRGLVCCEEPENGVHAARLRALLGHLQSLVTDPGRDDVAPGEPLSQLLMNSHSPVVLSAVRGPDFVSQVLFADLVAVADPKSGTIRRKTRIRPVSTVDQGEMLPERDAPVTRFEVQRILETVNQEA